MVHLDIWICIQSIYQKLKKYDIKYHIQMLGNFQYFLWHLD